MNTEVDSDLSIRIAPKTGGGYWRVADWNTAMQNENWDDMIQIFRDRINNRYLTAVQALIQADQMPCRKQFGFAIMALDCLLVETLHQFYKGIQKSPGGRGRNAGRIEGRRRTIAELGRNGQFYAEFFTTASSKFKPYFDSHEMAAVIFYEDIRCGILHSGETQNRSLIRVHKSGDDKTKLFEMIEGGKGIILYRDTFHRLLKEEFCEYCTRLAQVENHELRRLFVKKMGYVCDYDYGDGESE